MPIVATADAIARIDVAVGNAARAAEGQWCLPSLTEQPCLEIEGGRHPVVESALAQGGERFIANDCSLGPDDRLWLITGPNMGGKSTFLRQCALIALMAQASCFVPAGRRNRPGGPLFSRVGASSSLAQAGRPSWSRWSRLPRSAQATRAAGHPDEIGRGTSTYDGLAIAWAVVEAMHDEVRARTLFATHYHELTRLADRLDSLSLHHVRAREWKGDLVLLHEVADGAADRSYGIAVARLAGLPPAVVTRARSVLQNWKRAAATGNRRRARQLPLFAAMGGYRQRPLPSLDSLEPDQLSPREALDALYNLKRLAAERG
jgi:DNA mismatch repair protein MutS